MRIRALLFIPALAAAALAIGVSSASAATLFTTTAHSTRVTVGATGVVTSERSIDLTSAASPGTAINSCAHSSLHVLLSENTTARTTFTVDASSFTDCTGMLGPVAGTHGTPWKFTITGEGTMVGAQTSYTAALHNLVFDDGAQATFTGNLTSGVTVTQPTSSAAPICVDLNAAGTVSNPTLGGGLIDGKYCFTPGAAAGWSLT
jgi:hypothetical protein